MLCTVIFDSYRSDEREDVHAALKTLLDPGQPDWSPKGVYAYWDRDTHRLLYVGLASNLPDRFAQHNGLYRHGGGNKRQEIDDYFLENERLGFTVLIQSKAIGLMEEIEKLDFTQGATADQLVKVGEGQLIEMHKLVYGERPPWNRTGGSRDGKRWATAAPALLELLAARRSSLFAARRSLREIVASFKLRLFEATIHASRLRTVMDAHQIGKPFPDDPQERYERVFQSLMLRDGHLVEDLNASDDEIRGWLEKLADPAFWQEEATQWQHQFEGLDMTPNERQVLDLLDSVARQGTPTSHILATEEILQTGYLDQEVVMP